jgi:endonuclease/exonuclease/phosphatase (EEP) superfamily protein YafD
MLDLKSAAAHFFGMVLFLISLSHWFPLDLNLLELFSAFPHFTLALSVIVAVALTLLRYWIPFSFSVLAIVLSAALVLPHFAEFNSNQTSDFTIGQFNVYHGNPSPEQAILELSKTEVDIFTIQELNSVWIPSVDSLVKKKYPFHLEKPSGDCCYGIGLYSKFPILDGEVFELGETPAIRASININGQVITVISFHTKPPAFPNETNIRNAQMRTIAEMSNSVEGPLVVIGDFNIVPWDAAFDAFLKQGNLKAVRNGFQATYPMHFGIPLIPIDHITYSASLEPTSCETLTIPGSDHKGMVASFKLQ